MGQQNNGKIYQNLWPILAQKINFGHLYQVSSKTVPENLNIKFRSKFNYAFTNQGYFHCAILKVYPV